MKKYITYTRYKINDNFYADPNTNNKIEIETNGNTKFTETPFEFEGVFIAYIEFPIETEQTTIEYFKNLETEFSFNFITEEEANIFLSNIGDITVKDFQFTDNRIFDDLI